MKILVAEDSSTFRLILGELFKKLEYKVVFAKTGREAWNIFQAEYFPVLVTDWHMPEMDGMVLTRLIRANPHEKYTYIILLTAHGGSDNYHEGIKAGADDFLEKPPDLSLLAARLLVAQRIVGVQNHLKRLEDLLSICSYCKDVRKGDQWVPIEQHVHEHTGTKSSHGVCPKCFETRVKPEMEKLGLKLSKPGLW